jgi:hypothetical protein
MNSWPRLRNPYPYSITQHRCVFRQLATLFQSPPPPSCIMPNTAYTYIIRHAKYLYGIIERRKYHTIAVCTYGRRSSDRKKEEGRGKKEGGRVCGIGEGPRSRVPIARESGRISGIRPASFQTPRSCANLVSFSSSS